MVKKLKLSIIVPAYNEVKTIVPVLNDVVNLKLKWIKEIICVDDGSIDGTKEKLESEANNKKFKVKLVFHDLNKGKGAAIRSGLGVATGDYVIFFDADGECDANDIKKMVDCVESSRTEVLFGTRNASNSNNKFIYWYLVLGVKFLAWLINTIYNQHISDPEMGMKLIKRDLIDFDISEKGFGQEIEWTVRLAKKGIKINELPVKYYPRSYQQGKKITVSDGLRAVWLIFKFWFI